VTGGAQCARKRREAIVVKAATAVSYDAGGGVKAWRPCLGGQQWAGHMGQRQHT